MGMDGPRSQAAALVIAAIAMYRNIVGGRPKPSEGAEDDVVIEMFTYDGNVVSGTTREGDAMRLYVHHALLSSLRCVLATLQ